MGATAVRFLFGLPFAALFLAAVARAAPLPAHFSRLFTSSVSTSLKRPLSTALAA